jgi:hypothetical protein
MPVQCREWKNVMKDLKTEQFLNNGGFKWRYLPKVPLSEIDIKASEDNPSRIIRRLNEDLAISYGIAMEAGDEFPAIVLLQLDLQSATAAPGKKYLIATGVHRVKGAEAIDRKDFDAYVVIEPDKYREEVLIRQLNTIEGQGVTIQDRIAQVLLLHEKHPDRSLPLLCKEWRLREKTVRAAWTADQALRRGQRFGYDFNRAKLSKAAQIQLNAIHSDVVFQKAAQFAQMTGVLPVEIDSMIREIKKAPREETAGLAVVDRYVDLAVKRMQEAMRRHGRIPSAPAQRMLGKCKALLKDIEGNTIDHLHLSAVGDLDQAITVCESAVEHLKKVIAELERQRRLRVAQSAMIGTGAAAVH